MQHPQGEHPPGCAKTGRAVWARRGGGRGGGGGSSMHAGQMARFNHSSSLVGLPQLRAGTAASARAVGLGLGSSHNFTGVCVYLSTEIQRKCILAVVGGEKYPCSAWETAALGCCILQQRDGGDTTQGQAHGNSFPRICSSPEPIAGDGGAGHRRAPRRCRPKAEDP